MAYSSTNPPSLPSLILTLSILYLCTTTKALDYPSYSFQNHPLYTDEQFNQLPKHPAIMKKYYVFSGTNHDTMGVKFAPGIATYVRFPTKQPFATNLDALFVSPRGKRQWTQSKFLQVTLNAPARVILLLRGKNINFESPSTITGLDTTWSGLMSLVTLHGGHIDIPPSQRTDGATRVLPSRALCVETHLPLGDTLVLPHPRMIKVDGKQLEQYYLLFAKPGTVGAIAEAFERQPVPATVINRQTNMVSVPEPVRANEECPEWVHSLYVTESRDGDVAKDEEELLFWQTWHPLVDPMFWCYFSHEHGSYPGGYKPALGYTAWKTLDNNTVHKRQEESNEGFKVFAMPLHDLSKYLVFVVHMHVSQPRRFTTRFHTLICAVLDEQWNLELELHLKMDFGFAHGTLSKQLGRKPEPFVHEEDIRQELLAEGKLAGRRFNVLNIDEHYPTSVNQSFSLNCNIKPTPTNKHRVLAGIYEQWFGPLNTCSGSRSRLNKGIKFDIRNPSTAKRTTDGGKIEPIQYLKGNSVNRKLVVPREGFSIGPTLCRFFVKDSTVNLTVTTDGLFYTDSYFKELHTGPGPNSLRQFIKPGFVEIVLQPGQVTPVDGWGGHMDYQTSKNHSRRFMNIEKAALKMFN